MTKKPPPSHQESGGFYLRKQNPATELKKE
jgi:hypothetical protein